MNNARSGSGSKKSTASSTQPPAPSPKPAKSSAAGLSAEDRQRLDTDPDFCLLKHFGNSIDAIIARHPEGAEPKLIARALGMTEAQVAETLQSALSKMKELMQ